MDPEENHSIKRLREKFPEAVIRAEEFRGEITVWIRPSDIVGVARFLKNEPDLDYKHLSDLSGVDYLGMEREPRLVVNYHLYSLTHGHRLRLKVGAAGDPPTIPSVTSVWSTANWQELEVFDLYGVSFSDHPDLRRILMPEETIGHPLRKDFPQGKEDVSFTYNTPTFEEHRGHMRPQREK
ncbi:MAG: NADH-quinone oxidoreductase subunit C [Chloroflexi bacterium]|nr:NADH-quinone oxidoreductase subunit C [Chloroflexota bacterium]